MSPIQQMLLGVGAVATKTYVDDIFSTFLYKGTGSAQSINNGIDLSSEGGMVWIKQRTGQFTNSNFLFDTKRGTGKYLKSDSSATEDTSNLTLSAFNSNGFSVGSSSTVNLDYSSYQGTYSSFSFRKAPGFLDIIEWSGNGANRLINHNLGSVPGMVVVKCTSHAENWQAWHKSFGYNYSFPFNREALPDSGAANTWNSTDPTATQISVGPSVVNASGKDYVAYVFAGGDEGYNSVEFDGTGDYLSFPSSGHVAYGTGDFTIEAWLKPTSTATQVFLDHGVDDPMIGILGGKWQYYNSTVGWKYAGTPTPNVWTHFAVARESGTTRMFINGALITSFSDSFDYGSNATSIGAYNTGTFRWTGSISNARIVSGTAVYTSAFTPSTTPLTNITNTVLLCCNGDLPTSSTVNQLGTMTANGDPYTTGTSPFTSPDSVFGENEDQNVIKMGRYTGNGSESDGTEVYIGWEPTWLMVKRVNGDANWGIIDTMRGWTADGQGEVLFPNRNNNASSNANSAEVTPTGFKLHTTNNEWNGSNDTYMYVAIRRPDGYVGKPPELGTDVFAMDTGNGSTTIPAFDSGFPVDMNMNRKPASTWSWQLGTRLQGKDQLNPNTNDAEGGELAKYVWDSNAGFGADSGYDSSYQSWMWKRHAGFDVVTYEGNGVSGRQISHSLNKTIEMMWVKNRDDSKDWIVYHHGVNGGTNPEQYILKLNSTSGQHHTSSRWTDTAPTNKVFTVGSRDEVNENGENILALLFASVDGISKVGSYTGTANTQTITTGFSPRFVIIKGTNNSTYWLVLDTVRGWSSGSNDNYLKLNSSDAQASYWWGYPTSTGFVLDTTISGINGSGDKCIYYAHS